MARSIKKGPFVDAHVVKKAEEALPQIQPLFPLLNGLSGLSPLCRPSFHDRNRLLFPHVFSFSLIPLEVSILPVSFRFPFRRFDDFQQMTDTRYHSSNCLLIRQRKDLIQPPKPKAPNGFHLIVGLSDRTLDPFYSDRLLHIEALIPLPLFAFSCLKLHPESSIG